MIPMGGEEMPPMGSEENMEGDFTPDLNGGEPQSQEQQMDFDSNFDAGVEADEDTDPKKYIQQLTGKLSQTLNTYNNENGQPDTELGKYVLGMLVKQGTKGMDEEDKKEIIKKINLNNSDNEEMPEENNGEESMDDETPEMNEMPMESKTFKFTKHQIFENFGIAMDNKKDDSNNKRIDTSIKSDTLRNRKTRPFEAPKKFKE